MWKILERSSHDPFVDQPLHLAVGQAGLRCGFGVLEPRERSGRLAELSQVFAYAPEGPEAVPDPGDAPWRVLQPGHGRQFPSHQRPQSGLQVQRAVDIEENRLDHVRDPESRRQRKGASRTKNWTVQMPATAARHASTGQARRRLNSTVRSSLALAAPA